MVAVVVVGVKGDPHMAHKPREQLQEVPAIEGDKVVAHRVLAGMQGVPGVWNK